MKYSERLGDISNEQIQEAVTKHSLGTLVSTEKISSGLFGQNLFLTTDKGKYVLRGKPHFDWQFPTEKFFAEELGKIGIPTPIPYIVDNDTSIFGWEFVIMPRLEGVSISNKLDETYFNDSDRVLIAEAQGKFLAEVQGLTFDFCGKYDMNRGSIVAFDDEAFHIHIKSQILGRLLEAQKSNPKNTSAKDIEWFEILFFNSLNEISKPFIPTIVLQDYKFENTLIKKINNNYRITALFDLMECYVGNGEADLARTYCMYINRGRADLAKIFLASWQSYANLLEGQMARFPIYLILDRSIIWEWNQKNPAVSNLSFYDYMQKYISI